MRLSAPVDILATIPFLVGYHPSDSIVVLGMCEHRVTFTARDDLPPEAAEPDPGQVAYLVEVLLRQECSRLLLVGYGSDARVSPTVPQRGHAGNEQTHIRHCARLRLGAARPEKVQQQA